MRPIAMIGFVSAMIGLASATVPVLVVGSGPPAIKWEGLSSSTPAVKWEGLPSSASAIKWQGSTPSSPAIPWQG